MTRKSKREIERAVDDLDGGGEDDDSLRVVISKPGGDSMPNPDGGEGFDVVIESSVCVMMREQAEREGYDILGPAEDVPADDAVRVEYDGH